MQVCHSLNRLLRTATINSHWHDNQQRWIERVRLSRIYHGQQLDGAREATLDEAASRHLVRVLRLRAGEELIVFDGCGGEYPARISKISNGRVDVTLSEPRHPPTESPVDITLAQGLIRGERMDLVLQKSNRAWRQPNRPGRDGALRNPAKPAEAGKKNAALAKGGHRRLRAMRPHGFAGHRVFVMQRGTDRQRHPKRIPLAGVAASKCRYPDR